MSPSKNGKAHLVLLSPKTHMKQRLDILRKMEKGRNIIYVTITNSCDKLTPLITEQGIIKGHLFFVGCGKPHSDSLHLNCIHCPSPNALLSLSILIIETVKRIPGRKLLVFDSISNLFAYHDPNTVMKFISFIIKQLHEMKVGSLFFMLESDMKTSENKRIMLLADDVKE